MLLRLDEEEFAALEGMAEKEERSRSNMARLLYLQGVAISQKKKQ
ncbi:ribbon-helix-helix protein, CopG family [Salmonella enterica subsp. houtenae]|nr:ribbon-helix-helix protein, CopG family [Salmonella enterica subsp. enterica serovar Give]EAQ1150703.1 ribbon-helix-helix protein, CopG family [Salmonella enterica]EDQ6566018.1 ribbon-helix-helix protein, CopG family [Salmonella enterica subsp. houtenae]EDV0941800.1 ribbon-helix-helix protein, CopG family [Salmonella enterica subsp. enterica serovar Pomona]EAU9327274.1 ribbon-helix-helix protein, CopG family [Salmonella enterica]